MPRHEHLGIRRPVPAAQQVGEHQQHQDREQQPDHQHERLPRPVLERAQRDRPRVRSASGADLVRVSSRKTSSRVGRRSVMSSASSPSSRTTAASAAIRSRTGALTRRASASTSALVAQHRRRARQRDAASRTTTSIQSPPSDAFSAAACRRRSRARGRPPRSGRRAGRPPRASGWSAARSSPRATSARTAAQTSLRPRGSSPVVGSSRNSTGGDEDQARGEVEPPPHPARVLRHRPAARVREPEALQQLVGAPRRPPRDAEVEQPPEQHEVLAPAEHLVDRGVLADEPDPPPHARRRSRATSTPATTARPASGRSSVVRIRTAVVLPAPLGPSSPHTVPAGTASDSPSSATHRAEPLAAIRQPLLRTPYGIAYMIRSRA